MLAAHESCYLHAGLNPANSFWIKGKDARRFLSENFANGTKKLAPGQSRHGVMCNDEGLLMYDGMLLCLDDDELYTYWLGPYMQYLIETGDYDLEWHGYTGEDFMFQLGGPRSLEIVEAATEEDFHDLPFLNHRRSTIDGMDVRICRIGMAGSLAYEVHGKLEDSQAVYAALLKYGEKYGIKRLGRHAYWNTHTEGGFPQFIIHFPYAWEKDAGFMKWLQDTGQPIAYYALAAQKLVGVSTGRIFTWYYRKMVSLCTIDPAYAEIGTEVEVAWGSEGTRQKRIRAKVARYPYLNEERNSDVDVASVPRGTRD